MSADGRRKYRDINFTPERLELIDWVRRVVETYGRQGMNVSVRQVYYRAVASGLLPSAGSTYNKIQGALNDGRMAGLIPWTYVEDRGRGLRGLTTWDSPAAVLRHASATYLRDLWAGQPYRPEVWVEKQALEGVVGDICSSDELRVDFYATKGYDSQSQQWRAGQRLARYIQKGQRPIILYLGDHDPSGLHMTEDVAKRLYLFTGVPVMVQRIALTMTQIEKYNPPPFDVKMGDSRAAGYVAEHGGDAWELDALDPSVLKQLITDSVMMLRDQRIWDENLAEETDDKRELEEMIAGMGGEPQRR